MLLITETICLATLSVMCFKRFFRTPLRGMTGLPFKSRTIKLANHISIYRTRLLCPVKGNLSNHSPKRVINRFQNTFDSTGGGTFTAIITHPILFPSAEYGQPIIPTRMDPVFWCNCNQSDSHCMYALKAYINLSSAKRGQYFHSGKATPGEGYMLCVQ